jgi:hypothetical protein
MPDINQYLPSSGRSIKEDGSLVNLADKIDAIHKALVVDKNAGMQLSGSNIIQPSDIQSHLQTTIQTHNAVSVGANGWSESSWLDTDGFDKIAFTLLNDSTTNSSAQIIWSNDGINKHGVEAVAFTTGDVGKRSGISDLKARYCKLSLNNADAIAHTMSAWAYLKA